MCTPLPFPRKVVPLALLLACVPLSGAAPGAGSPAPKNPSAAVGGSTEPGHPLISASPAGGAALRLSWALDPSSLRLEQVAAGRAVRIPGFGLRPAPAGTLLPTRIELVAIPEGVTPRLSNVRAASPLQIPFAGIRTTPGAAGSTRNAGAPADAGGVSPTAASSVGPESPMTLGNVGYFRDQRFVEIRLNPAASSSDPEVLAIHPELEGIVSWDQTDPLAASGQSSTDAGGATPVDSPVLEPFYDRIFVNAEQGRGFRSRRPVPARGRKSGQAHTTDAATSEELSAPLTSTRMLSADTASAEAAELVLPAPRLRLEVSQSGIVRVTQAQMAAAAPDLAVLDPLTFRLTVRGPAPDYFAELPLFVSGDGDSLFEAGEYVEFYGQPPADTPTAPLAAPPDVIFPFWQLRDFTDTNVYWLDSLAGTRRRPATLDVRPNRNYAPATDWPAVARLEGQNSYRPYADNDPWVTCPRVQTSACGGVSCCDVPSHNFSLSLPGLVPVVAPASLRVVLQGWNGGAHRVDVSLNGTLAGTTPIEWSGLEDIERTYSVANAGLTTTSQVGIALPGNSTGTLDQVVVDFIEIGYRRAFTASAGELIFQHPDLDRRYDIGGFLTAPVVWYDVSTTDPFSGHPIARRLLNAQVSSVTGGFTTRFDLTGEAGGGVRRLVVASAEAVRAPASLRRVDAAPLCSASIGADLIVIGHPDLMDLAPGSALSDYLQHRQGQGLRTRVVNVLEVFDQFSGGLADVEGIRDFLSCAYSTWSGPPPAYVLLLGDGTSDYKNSKALPGWRNQVPAPIHTTTDALLSSYSADVWYASFRGDDFLPDILHGRISASTLQEAEQVLRKILRYEQSPQPGDWRARGLFVAGDGHDAGQDRQFGLDNDAAAAWFSPPFSATKLYYSQPPWDGTRAQDFRTRLQDEIDLGASVVNFVGHGNFTIWDGDLLLQSSDVALLRNTDRLPFFINSTCLMGGFHLDVTESLGEVLLESTPDTGGIAVLAPSGLSNFNVDAYVNEVLYRNLMGPRRLRTPGEVVLAARVALALQGSVTDMQNLTLLGDPALRLTLPAPGAASGLSAAAGNARVDLIWIAAPDAAGYHVYRSNSLNPSVELGAAYTRITALPVSDTRFADTQVSNTVRYAYSVTAVDASGFESAFSNLNTTCGSSALDCAQAVPYNPAPPAAPRGLVAQNPGVGFRIDLQWLPNAETDLRTYSVLWGLSPGAYTQRRDVGLVTSTRIEGLNNDVRYYFAVSATNTSDGFTPPGATQPLDNESLPSNEAAAVPTMIQGIRPPAMIRDLRIERDPLDPASVKLTWTRPVVDIYGGPLTVTGFQVHRSEARDFAPNTDTLRTSPPLAADVASWSDPGVWTDSRSFYYVVLAMDGAGRLSSASRAFPTGINDLRIAEERDTTTGALTGFVILSWGAVTRDIEGLPTVVDHYEIYNSASPFSRDQASTMIPSASVAALTLRIPTPAGRLFWSVLAADRRRNLSPF